MSTLTSADAVITIAVTGLFDTPQRLQGFATDDIFDIGQLDIAETAMGVDGILSAGYVNNPIDQTFMLMATSSSNKFFETWAAQSLAAQDIFRATAYVTLPAISASYVCKNGVLVNISPIPTAKKILQPRKYAIRWERVTPNPIN